MSILGTYRELLRNGPLTRLFVGEFVSSIGDWLYLVALVVLVYQETQDPVVLGIVGACVGGFIFTSIGGQGITGFNVYSMFVAVIGAIVVLLVYHAITGRRRLP